MVVDIPHRDATAVVVGDIARDDHVVQGQVGVTLDFDTATAARAKLGHRRRAPRDGEARHRDGKWLADRRKLAADFTAGKGGGDEIGVKPSSLELVKEGAVDG